MSVVLVTGAVTGIGTLTATPLARAGHTVFASMRDPSGRNADHAHDVLRLAFRESLDLRAADLDVQSQQSADAAVARVPALPVGHKPARTIVDSTGANVRPVLDAAMAEQCEFISRLGSAELLTVSQ